MSDHAILTYIPNVPRYTMRASSYSIQSRPGASRSPRSTLDNTENSNPALRSQHDPHPLPGTRTIDMSARGTSACELLPPESRRCRSALAVSSHLCTLMLLEAMLTGAPWAMYAARGRAGDGLGGT